jgi:hypothetical protein
MEVMMQQIPFKQGDRVRVTNYSLKTYGMIGEVICTGYHLTQARIDGCDNTLTFKNTNLQLINSNTDNITKKKEEQKMLMGKYDVAKIRFLSGSNTKKTYYYALYDDTMCAIGDTVVVQTAHHGMGIAMIDDIVAKNEAEQYMLDSCIEGREIVCKVDMTGYNERKAKREMAAKLKVEMDKKVQEMQELTLFEMMATKSPELKEMLDAYKSLIN